MDADTQILSAGTLVGAVLETAGLATQAHFLNDFAEYFSSLGAFIYIIAGIGAVISVAMFSSYRMAAYLLICPAIFWFCVAVRAPIDGVFWSLGKQKPQSVTHLVGAPGPGLEKGEKLEIAAMYQAVTIIFGGMLDVITEMVLKYHDSGDYLFLNRRYALDVLLNAMPEQQIVTHMFYNNLFVDCNSMMTVSMHLAHRDASLWIYERMRNRKEFICGESEQASEEDVELDYGACQLVTKELQKMERYRRTLLNEYQRAAEHDELTLDSETKEFILANRNVFGNKEYFQHLQPLNEATLNRPHIRLTCGDYWDITKEAILMDAERIVNDVEKVVLGNNAPEIYHNDDVEHVDKLDEAKLCRILSKKLGRFPVADNPSTFPSVEGQGSETFDPCNLVETTSAYILRNLITHLPSAQIATKIAQKSHYYDSKYEVRTTDANNESRDELRARAGHQWGSDLSDFEKTPTQVIDLTKARTRLRRDSTGQVIEEVLVGDDPTKIHHWKKFVVIESDGHIDAGYQYHQRYQTHELQQGIYGWAMHLPYIQGVMLYLIAAAYPFICFLILLPGRAVNFMTYLFFWLWVKSWDVGFAIVMVMEKILWNLLPNSMVEWSPFDMDHFANEEYIANLPNILAASLQVDPSYDIHAHFNYLSMALFAIPPITGFLALKGRHSVLASFTEGPRSHAQDSGEIAQGRYGMDTMNTKIMAMKASEGQVLRSYTGENLDANGRGAKATMWAAAAAGVGSVKGLKNAVSAAGGRAVGGGNRGASAGSAAENLTGAAAKGLRTYDTMRKAYNRRDAYKELAYGSFKEHRKRQGAVFAAMDAFGEHEMTHALEGRGLLAEEINLFQAGLGQAVEISKNVANAGAGAASNSRAGRGVSKYGGWPLRVLRDSALGSLFPIFGATPEYSDDAAELNGSAFIGDVDYASRWQPTDNGMSYENVSSQTDWNWLSDPALHTTRTPEQIAEAVEQAKRGMRQQSERKKHSKSSFSFD